MNWKVFRKGLVIAWKAAKVASTVGLPMGKHVNEGIRVLTAIEDAAKRERLKTVRKGQA
jgi:hypothetical protein